MAAPPAAEALRAAVGAGLALFLCGSMLAWLAADGAPGSGGGLFLIAPLGATAFLLFALPNSPLAQPWSAVVGNTVSGIVAVTILLLGGSGPIAAGVAVAGAMVAMSLLRAMHPPGGAIALATMLAGDPVVELAYSFVLAPILLDTLLLVVAAMLFHRLTGRTYPLGHYPEPGRHGTTDPDPLLRLGLEPEELQQLVQRFRQSTNIGLEDLAELLAAAEETLATKKVGNLTCADVMSRDLVTVSSGTPLTQVAALFREHHFKTLPVVDENARIAGIISQNDFIQRAIAARKPVPRPSLAAHPARRCAGRDAPLTS
ncbi:HPP family protein [Kineobactrum salinum]|uniref:CBS domain-containing protein n=1 Tax=Kineobactrum salinum TaxID=2708301 RepID=A0A6C0U307_9GAMM|nr:HPP family protein [Kineobactrum salinum]QIB66552.1 CBS domain-containing protein [Kineobactrum salinum]